MGSIVCVAVDENEDQAVGATEGSVDDNAVGFLVGRTVVPRGGLAAGATEGSVIAMDVGGLAGDILVTADGVKEGANNGVKGRKVGIDDLVKDISACRVGICDGPEIGYVVKD